MLTPSLGTSICLGYGPEKKKRKKKKVKVALAWVMVDSRRVLRHMTEKNLNCLEETVNRSVGVKLNSGEDSEGSEIRGR